MRKPPPRCDVVIIGAGLAGLAAARLCHAAGLNVVVLEANDRTGGRVWTREDKESGIAVDWGAEWIIPAMHHEVMALVQAANLSLCFPSGDATVQWKLQGRLLTGSYHQLKQHRPGFAAALATIEAQALQHAQASQTLTANLPLSACFDQITQDSMVRQLLQAAVFPLTGAAPDTVATDMLWQEIAFHGHSIDATLAANACRIAEGCGALVTHLQAAVQDSIFASTQVTAITQMKDGLRITADEHTMTARHCIVAMPLRTLSSLHFDPPLPDTLRQPAEHANAGRVAKVWATAVAESLSDEVLDTASILRYGYARKLGHGRWLLCGQILSDADTPVTTSEITFALRQAWPQAVIKDCEVADWPHVTTARASWQTTRTGWTGATQAFMLPFGSIHFAGGDIAPLWAGWMEGALLSGAQMARKVIAKSA